MSKLDVGASGSSVLPETSTDGHGQIISMTVTIKNVIIMVMYYA